MKANKTKEKALEWIKEGKPCMFRYGYEWKGAGTRSITQEKALELLPKFSFGMGFYELDFVKYEGVEILLFNEFSANDLY